MNIIITGPKHCGKTTIIKKIINSFSGSISGFITEFDDRASETRQLVLRNITGIQSSCAVKWHGGSYEVFGNTFDITAPSFIDKNSDLVVIDELGKFEKNSKELKYSVTEAFDSPCHVVASIRFDAAGWMQELKTRTDVLIFNVNEDTRNSIPDEIIRMLDNYSHYR